MIWDRDTKRSEQQSESLQLSNAVYLEDFVKLNISGVHCPTGSSLGYDILR